MEINGNQWKCEKFDIPLSPKTPEPMVTKLGVGDEIGNPYAYAEFH